MRRLFIMRKDLNMSVGKLLAQTMHCCEMYWILWIKHRIETKSISNISNEDIWNQYISSGITKTVCKAKSKSHLLKAKDIALEMGLIEGIDFGVIRDRCLTELTPEEKDGTTITGIWFCPLPDEQAHLISKKYSLYT